ncbi:iron-containing alcohol dehydrogenase [Hyphococcus flavus]|uniref:Alcohol dehydrogenase 2 n=1 Tax=Hyphococcus flavus TaxID=1866326 RepID=A0AAE9ZBN7_9PROT|nr:iron-containing alcohol dehydrogenase [Hyphococcus flavus]WDI30305.1 iron-containing alcohol dehydrogenase [Hyphococcus flavus]
MNFTFDTVPHIIFETGAAARLGEIVKERMKRPCVVTDKGVIAAGLIDGALQSLKTAGLDYYLFDAVEADPPARVVRGAIDEARKNKCDGVIGFGGGSSMDTAKVIACLINSPQSLEEIYGMDMVKDERAPLVLLPTTAGTGSEVTNISVITSDDDQKMGVLARQLYADIAVLDAALTLSMPRHVTNATGIDAMVHAIEGYTSKLKKNPVSDALAKEALRLLSSNIVSACDEPDNIEARENMLLGAMLAGQAFANAPVAAVHALAYPLGVHFHVPHGLANSLMLAPVLRFNASVAAPLYAELGDVIGANDTGDFETRSEAFVAKMTEICAATGVTNKLSDVGVSHNVLPKLAEDAAKIERLMKNNPRPVTEADCLALYTEVL